MSRAARTNDPTVFFLMNFHNGEWLVREAMESVLRRSPRAFELIVFDDGTDRSASLQESGEESGWDCRWRCRRLSMQGSVAKRLSQFGTRPGTDAR